MLKPMIAPQPCKDRNQYADDDEEAERNHPYPQPIAFALFPEPRVAVAKEVSKIIHFSSERDKGSDVVRGIYVPVLELWSG